MDDQGEPSEMLPPNTNNTFEWGIYPVSAPLDNIDAGHGYPHHSSDISYFSASWNSWNPYMAQIRDEEMGAENGFGFAIDAYTGFENSPAAAMEQGEFSWTQNIQDYPQQQIEGNSQYSEDDMTWYASSYDGRQHPDPQYNSPQDDRPQYDDLQEGGPQYAGQNDDRHETYHDPKEHMPDGGDSISYGHPPLLPQHPFHALHAQHAVHRAAECEDGGENRRVPPRTSPPSHDPPGPETRSGLERLDAQLRQQTSADMQKFESAAAAGKKRDSVVEGRGSPVGNSPKKKTRCGRQSQCLSNLDPTPMSIEPVVVTNDGCAPSRPATLHSQYSLSRLARGATFSRPSMEKAPPLRSTRDRDRSAPSKRESEDSSRPLSLLKIDTDVNNIDRAEYATSPASSLHDLYGSPSGSVAAAASASPSDTMSPTGATATSSSDGFSFSSTTPITPAADGPVLSPKGKAKGTRRTPYKYTDSTSTPAIKRRTNKLARAYHPDPRPKPLRRSSRATAAIAPTAPTPTAVSVPTSASASTTPPSAPGSSPSSPSCRRTSPKTTADQKVRSRAAATKCREKSKAALSELEAAEKAAERTNRTLKAELQALVSASLALRDRLLEHHDCDCEMIHRWLRGEAKRLTAEAAVGTRGRGRASGESGSGK